MGFDALQDLESPKIFYDGEHHVQLWGRGGAEQIFFYKGWLNQLINVLMTEAFVEQPLARVCKKKNALTWE